MILAVGVESVSVGSAACFFNEISGQIKVLFLSRYFIQFGESHFYNRVSRRDVLLTFFGTENFTDKVSVFDGYIQKVSFSCCQIMSYGRLVHVSAVIQFMAVDLLPS